MEMILHTVKLGFLDMLIEQIDGVRLKETLFLSFILGLSVQLIEESVTLLVEFQGLLSIDGLILEFESFVFEFDMDVSGSLKIDRCLQGIQTFAWVGLIEVSSVGVLRG